MSGKINTWFVIFAFVEIGQDFAFLYTTTYRPDYPDDVSQAMKDFSDKSDYSEWDYKVFFDEEDYLKVCENPNDYKWNLKVKEIRK